MITKETVEKVAALARINLTEEEKNKLTTEMGDILTYIDKLNMVDTKGVEPTSQVTGLENIFRSDSMSGKFDREKLLEQSPERKDDHVKVKAVFNND